MGIYSTGRAKAVLVGLSLTINALGCAVGGIGSSTDAINQSLGSCAPTPCAKITLSALPSLPETLDAAAKSVISSEVSRVLYAPLDVQNAEPSRDAVLGELKDRIAEYSSVSDAPIDWILTRTATVIHSNPRITSIEVASEGYLGGAHGFRERTLMTFDSKTGARLSVHDLIEDSSRLTLLKIIEAEFRRTRSVRRDQTLQDAGFFILPGQEMPLGENFALTDSGLEIQYNPYEVAPYSMGETRVKVPREAVEPLVKADMRSAFDSGLATR